MTEFPLQSAGARLILASGSATRAALLESAGLAFEVAIPQIDEVVVKSATRAAGGTPAEAALALAHAKAATITSADAVVIGADQILVRGDTWFDKPPSLQAAREHLMLLRGHPHTLVTAVVAHRGGQPIWQHVATPTLTMRAFSDAFLDAYLAAEGETVLSSVGAYRLEGRGAHLFDALEGEYSAILGLPMLPLLRFLRETGFVLA